LRASGAMALQQPFRFSTKRMHDTLGLVLYEYRVYGPGMGRWLSRDPIGERGGLNLYGFVEGNPICDTDAFGLTSYSLQCGLRTASSYNDPNNAGSLIPAVGLSFANLMTGGLLGNTDETYWFTHDQRAAAATQRALNYFRNSIDGEKDVLCDYKCPIIGSFWTGSEPITPTFLRAKEAGEIPENYWTIPQSPNQARYVLGGAEYRLTSLNVTRFGYRLTWTAEISIIDKIGWEHNAYGQNRLATFLFGPSREITRGTFTLSGSDFCDCD